MTATAAHRLRRSLMGLTGLAERDLHALWRDVTTAMRAREVLEEVLPALIDGYGSAAAMIATDWYDDLRDAENIDGRFRAITADLGDPGASALAGWAVTEATEPDTALSLAAGGMQRRIVNAARDTITGSVAADPGAAGWQRVARGDGCGFCRVLAGRGAVYTEQSGDFASHDDCHCVATPAWNGRPMPVRPYTPSSRNVSDADRARTRDWIREHDSPPRP